MIINTTYTKRLKSNTKSQHLALQKGFSLIELMISITIGLLIMVALGSLFLNINRANNEMAKTNSQIENGRFAIQLLQEDIVHAGFWGTYVPQFDDLTLTAVPADVPNAVPDPCLDYAAWTPAYITNLLGIPVQVYGDTPPSGGGCVTNLATNKQADTDVLVVHHAETCIAGSGGNCEAYDAGKLYFQSSLSYFLPLPRPNPEPNCPAGLPADDKAYMLNTGTKLDDPSLGIRHQKDCATPVSDKRKFISNIYYIRNYANTVGDGIPTLMVSQFDGLAHQEAVPLIEGIEGFRVELGIDSHSKPISGVPYPVNYDAAIDWDNPVNLTAPKNRGDGVPDDAFVRCTDANTPPCTFDKLTNVVAVKLYVLARSDKVSSGYIDTKTYKLGSITLPPFNDGFKRHVFSTTVRLNNISMRRETPP
jgi:type IV pilus assembly protein PilW